ncbi:MAG: YIP1 family protein [Holophagaceae bacterium]
METTKSLIARYIDLFIQPSTELKEARSDSWKWALLIQMAISLILVIVWSQKVDWQALIENAMQSNSRITPDMLDTVVSFQEKWGATFGIVGVLFGTPIVCFIFAALFWGIGRASFLTPEAPTYTQALVVTTYSGLAVSPKSLLAIIFCFLRPVGGLSPESLSPTTLSYWVSPENAKLKTFFMTLDPFMIFSLCIVYWGSLHVMGTSKRGALVATLMPILFIAIRVIRSS